MISFIDKNHLLNIDVAHANHPSNLWGQNGYEYNPRGEHFAEEC